MATAVFVWDEQGETYNYARRGIAFGEAATVFLDDALIVHVDGEHPSELRFVSVGFSSRGRLLGVVTEAPTPGEIRMISARRATTREQDRYERRSR